MNINVKNAVMNLRNFNQCQQRLKQIVQNAVQKLKE